MSALGVMEVHGVAGPAAGRVLRVPPRVVRKLGGAGAPVSRVADDLPFRGTRLWLAQQGSALRVRDLGTEGGVYLRGRRNTDGHAAPGERFRAGESTFEVRVAPAPGARLDPTDDYPADPVLRLQAVANAMPGRALYALLDAAREPAVLTTLRCASPRYQSLYEGAQARPFAAVAPYLVRVPRRSYIQRRIFEQAWGHSWGVLLTSDLGFRAVRRHLRRFLLVRAGTQKALFRYYDPRVLRTFLPSASDAEWAAFFGPVQVFLAESEGGEHVLAYDRYAPAEAARHAVGARFVCGSHDGPEVRS